ncbi:hypothetical protein PYCCODRAFT_15732 [Trametes coccinea BRFM310]|uniref:Uncharacterized protein n=1 Tax=Trametes coccinea (strain BRFM310) TaxID=1353009 RepID=A0A1Y2J4S6_TRAC3|nr:hypothetical protein PYCCODRAFT_15732 [Trametes coccinea BRFM310]
MQHGGGSMSIGRWQGAVNTGCMSIASKLPQGDQPAERGGGNVAGWASVGAALQCDDMNAGNVSAIGLSADGRVHRTGQGVPGRDTSSAGLSIAVRTERRGRYVREPCTRSPLQESPVLGTPRSSSEQGSGDWKTVHQCRRTRSRAPHMAQSRRVVARRAGAAEQDG